MVAAPALLTIVAPVQLHGACAANQVQIAVVVDFGTGRSVSAACVGAGTRDSGAAVLAARASQLGTAPPRSNASGLICAIDGYPSEGCGDQTGGHYAYWSYWHGDASGWTYSNVGPAGGRAQPGTVEGWRFQPAGAGNPSDPPPRGSPDATTTCRPASPPATSPLFGAAPTSRSAARPGGTGGGPATASSTPSAGAPTSSDAVTTTTAAAGSSTDPTFLAVLQALGKTPKDVSFAVATVVDPTCNTTFVAFRIQGVDQGQFEQLYVAESTKNDGTAPTKVSLGGKDVWKSPSSSGNTTTYAYFKGDTLLGVVAPTDDKAAAGLSALP